MSFPKNPGGMISGLLKESEKEKISEQLAKKGLILRVVNCVRPKIGFLAIMWFPHWA
jgi:hypothetical protein